MRISFYFDPYCQVEITVDDVDSNVIEFVCYPQY